jgi:hypothetical protein
LKDHKLYLRKAATDAYAMRVWFRSAAHGKWRRFGYGSGPCNNQVISCPNSPPLGRVRLQKLRQVAVARFISCSYFFPISHISSSIPR